MRLRLGTLISFTASVPLLALAGCKPTYPACESDDHCADKKEVCINKQCQECRDDAQCTAKYGDDKHECVSAKCELKPESRANADCASVGEGLVCRSNKCVPECAANEDCASGFKCDSQKCVPECEIDIDCGPGAVCKNGRCEQEGEAATKVSSACNPLNPGAGEVIRLDTVAFDFNEFDLTVDARGLLDQGAQCLQQTPGVTIVIEGHADDRGTVEYNMALGEKRANAVKTYLKNLGVSTSRMQTRSKGENEPMCSAETESCWARNRRVQFIQKRGSSM